jgi:hypothetical protein
MADFDFYGNILPIIGAIFTALIAVIVFNYIRTKKLPPTDEPLVGDYKILLDVGSHIIPFEGSVHYFTKIINPKHFYIIAEALSLTKNIDTLRETLDKMKCYYYAIRKGTQKYAIISIHNPIETAPFFKTEEETRKKIVQATGSIGKKEVKGYKVIVMDPQDLSTHTLKPKEYQDLGNFGDLLLTILEKAPLTEEFTTEQEKNKILQGKVNDMSEELGKTKDEVEMWKELARKQGVKEEVEGAFNIPKWIKTTILYGAIFVIGSGLGYLGGQSSPDLAQVHPIIFGFGSIVAFYILKRLLGK